MPLVQGATCRVVVDARCPPVGSTTLRWVLTCGERVSRGSGKSSSVTTEERWSHRGSLEVHQGRHVGSSWQVALDLPLPVDLPPTDPDAGIAWELTLEPVGGTGAIAFPLPVVAAQGPGPHLTRAEVASTTELHAGDTLAAAGLHLATTRQGLRITKAAGQGSTLPWASLGGSLVVACLLGLVLVHLLDTKGWQMPTYILAVIVGAISVGHLLLWHSLLQVRILEVDPQGVGLATGLLAAGRSRRWSLDAIRSLDLRSRQSVGNVPHYQIVLTATDGSVTALTPHLGPASQAEAVLTFLDQALGRS
jgi:hypothetical protein